MLWVLSFIMVPRVYWLFSVSSSHRSYLLCSFRKLVYTAMWSRLEARRDCSICVRLNFMCRKYKPITNQNFSCMRHYDFFWAINPWHIYLVSLLSRLGPICADLLVIIATWIKTYGPLKIGFQTGMNFQLITLLIRDGKSTPTDSDSILININQVLYISCEWS